MNKIWAAGGAAFVVDRYRLVALMGALSDPWLLGSWRQAFREIDPRRWDDYPLDRPNDRICVMLDILYPPVFRDTDSYVRRYNAEKWECADYNKDLPVSKNKILGVRQYDIKRKC